MPPLTVLREGERQRGREGERERGRERVCVRARMHITGRRNPVPA